MYDEPMRELLRELPRIEASTGFADAVIARAHARRTHTARWLAAAGIVLVGGLGVMAQRSVAAREREQIIQEQRAIAVELQELKSLNRSADPIVVVGGDENVDFVLDLRDEAAQRSFATVKLPASPRGSFQ